MKTTDQMYQIDYRIAGASGQYHSCYALTQKAALNLAAQCRCMHNVDYVAITKPNRFTEWLRWERTLYPLTNWIKTTF